MVTLTDITMPKRHKNARLQENGKVEISVPVMKEKYKAQVVDKKTIKLSQPSRYVMRAWDKMMVAKYFPG